MATVPAQSPAADSAGGAQVTTLLGRGSEFEGKLSFEGTVRVDGKLSGEIFTEDVLLIGEGAEVRAEINVGAVVIEGSVQGNIHAKRSVEIRTPGRVRGNITTPSLFIEKGVMFDGNCQMEPSAPGRPNGPALAVAKPKVAPGDPKASDPKASDPKAGGEGKDEAHAGKDGEGKDGAGKDSAG